MSSPALSLNQTLNQTASISLPVEITNLEARISQDTVPEWTKEKGQELTVIRQKRLAKLAAAASSAPRTESETTDASISPITKAAPKVEPSSKPVRPSSSQTGRSSPAQTVAPKTPEQRTPPSKPSPSASNARIVANFLAQSDDDWVSDSYERILQCTVDESIVASKGYKLVPELVEEFKAEGLPLRVTKEQIERVLYARLSLPENAGDSSIPLFDYLIGCWKRVQTTKGGVRSIVERGQGDPQLAETAKRRVEGLEPLRALLVSYSALVVNPEMADTFPQPKWAAELGPSYVARKLLLDSADEVEAALPRDFLEEFISFHDSADLPQTISPIINSICARMREEPLYKSYQIPLRAFGHLLTFREIAIMLPSLKNWIVESSAKTFEVLTILGPFFSKLSTFPDVDPKLAEHYFASSNPFGEMNSVLGNFYIGARNAGDVRATMASLRGLADVARSQLHGITMGLIKASPETREGVLAYFGAAIAVNTKRGRMQFNPIEVSSDGFVYNIMQVCLKLCEPIMDSRYSKIHLIDPDYFNYSSRIDITDHTRMNADKPFYEKHLQDWKEKNLNPQPANFISDVFYLTLASHHYSLMSTLRQYGGFVKQLEELRKHIAGIKAERDSGAWAGPRGMLNEEMLKKFQKQLDKMIAYKLSFDVALKNKPALENSLRFYDLVMMWLIRCNVLGSANVHYPTGKTADGVDWNRVARGEMQDLNLNQIPEEVPVTFAVLPEWIIEDICEFYLFIVRNDPGILENNPRDAFMTFAMTILANPHLVRNPHLKSKLVEILFTFTWPLWVSQSGQTSGRLDGVFSTHPMAQLLLVPNLMRFYVDAEHTGASTQFYDKFNIRYNISQILKGIWAVPVHRKRIVEQSRNTAFFVRFVALLNNDTTYLLDESLSKLKEIQQLQLELAEPLPDNASQEDQQRREERAKHLKDIERHAHSYMSLGNETVHMLQYMTTDPDIVNPFMEPEIVERLASMLDFNLAALVGPRCTELKVQNPEKYRFEPKRLLCELVDIYIHLSHRPEFILAVTRDERSYRKDLFVRASSILLKNNLKNQDDLASLREFVDKVEASIASTLKEEEELGDVPDEFLDPLLYSLMEDPVILPTSGISVDRSTIKSHLLSDAHDPFNRQPLTIDQVVPNDDLRNKISQWRQQRKAGGVQPMDTT
ncbi:ubiquitin elongating factor core-domain-containing protein [Phlyctochytrium arcticum]|nr:ubiquitin elongating factor core-domain-containing protein [Phlyctochytrium arcticum]